MPFPAFFLLATALGAREGITNRREKKTALALEAERQDRLNEIGAAPIPNMGGSNKFDTAQAELMAGYRNQAVALAKSQNAEEQRKGLTMLAQLQQAQLANTQQNETEFRADERARKDEEIRVAGLGLADNAKRVERELEGNKQYRAEMKPLRKSTLHYNQVKNLLDNNDQLASLAGLTAFVKSIDDSVVREGELLKYTGANGAIIEIVNLVNKSAGKDFDPTTKQSIRNASAALMNAAKLDGVAVTEEYKGLAAGFGLREDRVLAGAPENIYTPIPIDREAESARLAEADAAEAAAAVTPFPTFDEATPNPLVASGRFPGVEKLMNFSEGVQVLADKALQTWVDMGRNVSGATLEVDPQTGEMWETDAQGNKTRFEGTPDMQRQTEIFRIQNSGVELTPSTQRRLDGLRAEQERVEAFERRIQGRVR